MTELEYGLQVVDKIIQDSVTGQEHKNERWESFTNEFIDSIKTAKEYVDCGAEYGFYIKLALKYGSPDIRVFAFEPEPVRFELLIKTFASYPNVIVQPYAISDCLQQRLLVKPGVGFSSSFSMHTEGDRIAVDTIMLDSVLSDVSVDVLKMDIEGAEDLAIIGGLRVIDRSRKLVMFVEFHPDQSDARLNTYRYLLALGFQISDEDAAKMIHGGRVVLRRE